MASKSKSATPLSNATRCDAHAHSVSQGFFLLATSACAGKPRPDVTPTPVPTTTPAQFVAIEVIGELKDFEERLGGEATENFLRHSDRHTADNRCYFTGKLELPEFYSSLKMVREDEAQCAARADEHDTFFYPVQAVASGEETVTVSLAEAPIERVLVVVPHEDFHNQPEARKAPTEVSEAAATLIGFLTASAFAKERFGAESTAARLLDLDADLFLRKSLVVNVYYQKVSELYQSVRAGRLTSGAGAREKGRAVRRAAAGLFAESAGLGVVQQMSVRPE